MATVEETARAREAEIQRRIERGEPIHTPPSASGDATMEAFARRVGAWMQRWLRGRWWQRALAVLILLAFVVGVIYATVFAIAVTVVAVFLVFVWRYIVWATTK